MKARVNNDQLRKLIAELKADGWDISPARNGHLKVTKVGHHSCQIPRTPSEYRSVKNVRVRLRRIGAAV